MILKVDGLLHKAYSLFNVIDGIISVLVLIADDVRVPLHMALSLIKGSHETIKTIVFLDWWQQHARCISYHGNQSRPGVHNQS